jgi:para-nitrobenzyl esterase
MKFSTLKRAAGRLAVCLTAAAALVACGGGGGDSGTPVVTTTSGQVVGNEESSMHAYLGIPYAAPPTGTNRWRAPQAPASWGGVRKTQSFGAHCPQGATPFGAASVSEDCLYLNVYRPKTGSNHPVMVWIHGGAFYLGLSNQYNPQRLVEQGVVVVTINYRLGALGFLSHQLLSDEQGGASGNYGLMDQQAALRWVRDNITGFGGDASNVTIFGESAGGFSVHSHIASPGSSGLFHKAIIQSGAYALDGQPTLAAAQTTGQTLNTTAAALLSQPACTTVACLRALPVTALLQAQQVAWPSGPIPAVDGSVLPQSVRARMTAGTHNRVPVIQGNTKDEWRLFVALDEVTPTSVATPYKGSALAADGSNYQQAITGTFPYLAAAPFPAGFVNTLATGPYAPANYGNNPSLALGALGTDLLFACNARTSSALQENYATVYAYEFADDTAPSVSFAPATISFPRGAEHTSELAYLFDIAGKSLTTANQRATAATMVTHWTRFARTGNPNAAATPNAWRAWGGGTDDVMTYNNDGTTSVQTDAQFAAAHRCGTWATTAALTTSGLVIGAAESNTMVSYKGIPYAAPPVGALRWAPPTAPTGWVAPRLALAFGSACPQSASLGSPSTNEDCLYLNVFTPTKPGPHPVMVWFHGGAFVGGTASTYIPTGLVNEDTVVVSVNYRLGALGFLAHPALSAENTAGPSGAGASGNYGLMDQQRALQWVQSNIANFGGNPANVTIFGESAGGASVMAHLASAGSANLFHKAIVMSGAYSSQNSLANAYTGWAAVPTAGSCSTSDNTAATATCLRNMTVAQLLSSQATAYPSGPQPIADGRVLTASAGSIIAAGTHNRVPVMQGSTRDEWRYFVASSELSSGTPLNGTTYPIAATALLGSTTANALLPFYPTTNYGGSAALAYGALGTDVVFACPGRNSSLELQQHTPVYAFEFRDRTAPPPLPTVGVGGALSFSQGAAHSAELTYLFTMASRGALNAEQQALASTMVRYWSRFARSGNPNGGTDATWAPFTAASPVYQGLDIASASGVAPLGVSYFGTAALPEGHFCTAYTPTP